MSGKRLDPQEQHNVAPSARERAADKTTDTARTENRMSHKHDRKRRSREPLPTSRSSVVRVSAVSDPRAAEILLRWLQRPRQAEDGDRLQGLTEEQLEGLYAGSCDSQR
jgi:hypothetical protein